MQHLARTALILLAASGVSRAQTCGGSFREGFEQFSNEGAWVWDGTFQASIGSGGVPGFHVRSEQLYLAAPAFRSTADSPFTGDYRALEVTSLGIDLKAFVAEPGACQRPVVLLLETDSGTDDPLDDRYVYTVAGPAAPCLDGAWHGYSVVVPARELTLPPGWRPDPASPLSDDATWNAVIADVSSVRWSVGDPHAGGAPAKWQLGADNARIAFGRGPSTFCDAYATSEGCHPGLEWSGTPSASGGTFTLRVSGVVENRAGLVFYGFEAAALPLQAGLLCVAPPLTRSPAWTATGTGQPCSGRLELDFNAVVQSGRDPALVAGATVLAQFWGRDPGAAAGSILSNAIRFTICP